MQDPMSKGSSPSLPKCPVCDRLVEKSPQECPHCHVSHHPNCWRQVTYCPTCGVKNPERSAGDSRGKRPYIKRGEAVSFAYHGMIRNWASDVAIPAGILPTMGVFLFMFRAERQEYLWLVMAGGLLLALAKLIHSTGRGKYVVSPSTRCLQRHCACMGISWIRRVLSFDDIAAFRIDGERRFKGSQKGVPSYWYSVHWVVAVTTSDRRIRISDEIRTDQDPTHITGQDYEYGGLYPQARKAGAVVGVDTYVAPHVPRTSLAPTIMKTILMATAAVLIALLL